jgi:hypothetical protein
MVGLGWSRESHVLDSLTTAYIVPQKLNLEQQRSPEERNTKPPCHVSNVMLPREE